MRLIVTRRPPELVEGITLDSFASGSEVNISPSVAMLLIAAGWARTDTRTGRHRRGDTSRPTVAERRVARDRRTLAM